MEHVVAPGDTLAALAKKYYGDDREAYWMRIYHANATRVSLCALGVDSNAIKPGEKLTIPPPPPPESMSFQPAGPAYDPYVNKRGVEE
jgi:nucleoid-associated protein YgaU